MTLVVTVVLSLVAITASMVIVQQTLAAATANADRADAAVAQRIADDVTAQFAAQLANDPQFYTAHLFYAERPRVCAATGEPIAAAGAPDLPPVPWPVECGPTWEYLPAGAVTPGYNPETVLARAQIAQPTIDDPALTLTALATIGSSEHATQTRYQVPSAARVTAYSSAVLNLDTLAATVTASGTIYAPGEVVTPTRPEHTAAVAEPLAGARVLTECAITGPAAGAISLWEAKSAAERAAAGCLTAPTEGPGDVRDLSAAPLSATTAIRSLAGIEHDLCPSGTPTLTPSGSASALCLTAGRTAVTVDGTVVTVARPDSAPTAAYRLTFLASEGAVPSVQVDAAGTTLSDPDDQAAAAAAYTAGTHPVSPVGATWVTLGIFPLPQTGAILTDTTTYIGACAAHFAGGECSPTAPGEPVTVIAGTLAAPANLIVASPLAGTAAAPLGLVATGRLDIAAYATTAAPGANLTLEAHMYGAGIGVTGPSITSRPSAIPRGTLTIAGTLAGATLGPLPGWSAVHLSGADASELTRFVTFTPYWRQISHAVTPASAVCGQVSCAATW